MTKPTTTPTCRFCGYSEHYGLGGAMRWCRECLKYQYDASDGSHKAGDINQLQAARKRKRKG